YNKSGRPHGKAVVEMQSYISVLAHTRVPLVDKKWTQLPKDLKEQIWEAVQMAYVVGEWVKKMVLSSVAKKWKDFKSTITRQFILPFANEKEKLKEPSSLYKFIDILQWDAVVASRLSPYFEAMHSEQSQRREKYEYNHRLSRKGYVSLEDQLEETMLGEKIDRSLLWKKAREDKRETSLTQRLQR
ncbi:PREDICTED: transposase, partial [Prunus dulcis]